MHAAFVNKWLLLADVHIKKDTYNTLKPTYDWIIEQTKLYKPRHIFLLGDTTDTRHHLHFETFCKNLYEFIKELRDNVVDTVHILIGNHCMHHLEDRTVNSMVYFQQWPKVKVYSEITPTTIDGVPCLFIPYHHDQTIVQSYLNAYNKERSPQEVNQTFCFFHGSIDGASMNGMNDHSHSICKNSGLTVNSFSNFKYCWTGHFHIHKTYKHNHRDVLTYVGSPTQFTFGDVNDCNRGLVLCDAGDDNGSKFDWILVKNPHADRFRKIAWKNLIQMITEEEAKDDKKLHALKNKHVLVDVTTNDLVSGIYTIQHEDKIRRCLLEEYHVAQFKCPKPKLNDSQFDGLKFDANDSDSNRCVYRSVGDMIKQYAKEYTSHQIEDGYNQQRTKYIFDIIDNVYTTEGVLENSNTNNSIFIFDIHSLTIENFMGIQNKVSFNIQDFQPGVWCIKGKNGSGTILLCIKM